MTELEKRERNEPRKPGLPTRDEIDKAVAKAKRERLVKQVVEDCLCEVEIEGKKFRIDPELPTFDEIQQIIFGIKEEPKMSEFEEIFHSALNDILRVCVHAPQSEEIREIEHIVSEALTLYLDNAKKTKYRNFKDMYFHEKETGK